MEQPGNNNFSLSNAKNVVKDHNSRLYVIMVYLVFVVLNATFTKFLALDRIVPSIVRFIAMWIQNLALYYAMWSFSSRMAITYDYFYHCGKHTRQVKEKRDTFGRAEEEECKAMDE